MATVPLPPRLVLADIPALGGLSCDLLVDSGVAGTCSPEFVELQKKIARHLDAIVATAENGLTNVRVESVNNKFKVIVRMAYGLRSLDNLFAMVMLRCSGLEVPLPGRS
jgi:hypothetical protein